ncbi:CBS domain-containing protein CBSX3, mitochondrial [Vitis vinifera]|uniref:CBS domain-containing protein CBSX3, mitochondrial n=1 Tax=Vitis vinifera TaxID=29760 RepID=A0A438KNE2_VITVI|nr:CBS domain-containing protein CBSX3, mitochondrial [Vitis vinifera]
MLIPEKLDQAKIPALKAPKLQKVLASTSHLILSYGTVDYLRKIIVQGRSSKSTKVGDIMTEENKLITVSPNTKVLRAMQLMTDNRIRHIPVIDDKEMIGMVSIGDVVRAVVTEHREELDRLNAYIQGGY